jgi:hypothetical protein
MMATVPKQLVNPNSIAINARLLMEGTTVKHPLCRRWSGYNAAIAGQTGANHTTLSCPSCDTATVAKKPAEANAATITAGCLIGTVYCGAALLTRFP